MVLPEMLKGPAVLQVPGWTDTYPGSAALAICGADHGAFDVEGGTRIEAVPLAASVPVKVKVSMLAEPAVADDGASETPSAGFGAAEAVPATRTQRVSPSA